MRSFSDYKFLLADYLKSTLKWMREEEICCTFYVGTFQTSFSQYYSSDIPKDKEKKNAAVKLKGEKLVHSDMHVTEVALSVKDIHRKARSCGVSITVLLTAMMLCSIREEIPKNQQKRPVALMIPVNLRNYFPSQSMTNFFGWIEVGYIFSDDRSQSGKQEHYGSLF